MENIMDMFKSYFTSFEGELPSEGVLKSYFGRLYWAAKLITSAGGDKMMIKSSSIDIDDDYTKNNLGVAWIIPRQRQDETDEAFVERLEKWAVAFIVHFMTNRAEDYIDPDMSYETEITYLSFIPYVTEGYGLGNIYGISPDDSIIWREH